MRVVAGATLALAVLVGCGGGHEPSPAAPNDAPAKDVVVRTSRFAIHANAYVDFYAAARVAPLRSENGDAGAAPLLDAPLVAKLGACSDDPCAKSSLVGTPFDGLDAFLHDTWAAHEIDTRRTLGRSGTPLMNSEDALAPTLARQIGIVWPNDPVVVYVAHAKRQFDMGGGRDGAVLDVDGECLDGNALLECLFTRALEVLLPDSELGRALEEERARLEGSPSFTSADLLACIAALASDAAVAAIEQRYTPTRAFVARCSERQRAWLADEWPRRMHGEESPRVFAARLVAEAARAAW